jgi:hypothetical protein
MFCVCTCPEAFFFFFFFSSFFLTSACRMFITLRGGSKQVFSCTKGFVVVAVTRGLRLTASFDDDTTENLAIEVSAESLGADAPVSLFPGETDLFRVELDRSGRFVLLVNDGTRGVVIVSPVLRLAGKDVFPQALSVKTVLSRCLGPLTDWNKVLSFPGYTAVHFTPVQQTGTSAYCIRDHSLLGDYMGRGVTWDSFAKVWMFFW